MNPRWIPFTLLLSWLWLISATINPILAESGDEQPYLSGMMIKNNSQIQAPISATITFLPAAQVMHQPTQLSLQNPTSGTIHYTTNGSLPNINSQPYSGTLSLSQTTIIRAQLFDAAGNPMSGVQTQSYIMANYTQTIPIISLVTDWEYFNALHNNPDKRGAEWERPLNIEYFEPGGKAGFNIAGGMRIHGGFSRLYNIKKSYRLYFRKDYSGEPGKLNYPVFTDSVVTQFDKLVLRSGFQDSFTHRNIPERADTNLTAKYIGDQVTRNLHRNMGQPIVHGKWVLVYLNGEFWGLYNLTEHIDQQFFESYAAQGSQWDVIVKENGWDAEGIWFNKEEARDGDYGPWLENQAWVGSTNFTQPENIGVLKWRVDMENVYAYMFLEAYVQNYDWPEANWMVYRRSDPGAIGNEAKWRMIVWDAEYSFGGGSKGFKTDMNTLERVYGPHDSITRILEKPFIGNCALKHEFVNRAREYLGVENLQNKPLDQIGQLSKANVKAEIMAQANIVRPFIQMEANRWAPDMGVASFDLNIQRALQFAEERQDVILHHLDILRYQTFTECK